MISADLFRAAVALTWAGSLAVAYAVAFGLSVGAVPFNPAAGSLLPDVVGDGEVIDANSAMWTAAVSVQIVLAPVAGFVIAALVVEIAFLINAATFKVWALLILSLRGGRGWGGVLAGARTARADVVLRRLATVRVLAAMPAGATSGLLVVLADRWLGVGVGGFATMRATRPHREDLADDIRATLDSGGSRSFPPPAVAIMFRPRTFSWRVTVC